MTKKNLIQNKKLIIIFTILFIFTNSYSQQITFDTLKNHGNYTKYLSLSKKILDSFKKNPDMLLSKYIEHQGSHNKDYLKSNFSWVHELMMQNVKASIKSMILEKSELPFPNHPYKETSLSITYSFGRVNCVDTTFENTLMITFSDISKGEENFNFIFNNCLENEKVKKEILAVPTPKNK